MSNVDQIFEKKEIRRIVEQSEFHRESVTHFDLDQISNYRELPSRIYEIVNFRHFSLPTKKEEISSSSKRPSEKKRNTFGGVVLLAANFPQILDSFLRFLDRHLFLYMQKKKPKVRDTRTLDGQLYEGSMDRLTLMVSSIANRTSSNATSRETPSPFIPFPSFERV